MVVGVDFLLYYLLIQVIPLSIAKAISFIASGVVSYGLNKYWTFRKSEKPFTDVIPFVATNAAALVLNVTTNKALLIILSGDVLTALVLATGVTAAFAFGCFKFWVFR